MDTLVEQFDGPRLVGREELIDSIRLSHLCFGGPEIENEEKVLANYLPPRRGGTYVLMHEGKPVSQIGIFHDQLKMYDGRIRTGSIGGVCTHPDYRRKGLASHLMEHCTQQLVKEGARFMLISGDEGVYMRLGNVLQGKYIYFSIKPDQKSLWRPTPSDLTVRRATRADALLCSQLYQAEPVHFVRQKSDFLRALQEPLSNTYIHADQWIIERAGQPMAYLFLGFLWGLPDGLNSGIRHVGEYAGSRAALADAIPALMRTGNIKDLTWPVPWQDVELMQLLQGSGYPGSLAPYDGHTWRIIDFPGFMKDLNPLVRARVDAKLWRGIRFEQSGPLLGGSGNDRYTITRGADRLELDGAGMTRLVMGNADPQSEAIHVPGALAEVISQLLPLPSFLPGLNYH
jgi:GNAT superfamily N-acetyltransferase